MTDTEMLALDTKLSAIFKQRSQSRPPTKQQKKQARHSVLNFKHRILDLLESYVRNQAANPLALALPLPLLHLVRRTGSKALAHRACDVLVLYQRCWKKARSGGKGSGAALPEAGHVVALLREVHAEAGMDKSRAFARAASAASLTLVSVVFAADRLAIDHVAAVYAKTQADWVLGKSQLQSSFFADWNNWCQNQASQVRT